MQGTTKAPAADAVLRILSFLGSHRGPVQASVIAAGLSLPRSTVYQLLGTLRQHGFIVHIPEQGRYGLGMRSLELSSGYARQQPLSMLGRPLIAQLVDQFGETAHLSVLHGREVLYIAEERAPRRPPLVVGVGVRLPSDLTASGRALLSALPPAQLRALFPDASAFADRTGSAPGGYRQLRTVLQRARSDGFAFEDGEVIHGVASIGVAVRDHLGWPTAVIAVTFPRENYPQSRWPEIAAELSKTAAELGRRIGGRVD